MKLTELKIGDKIKHYLFGELIIAEVIEILPNGVKTQHEAQKLGNNEFKYSFVLRSLYLQYNISQTTPRAYTIEGENITA